MVPSTTPTAARIVFANRMDIRLCMRAPIFATSVAIAMVAMLVSVAHARECTTDDYAATFSPCNGGKRLAAYHWKEPHTCTPNSVNLPTSFKSVSCECTHDDYGFTFGPCENHDRVKHYHKTTDCEGGVPAPRDEDEQPCLCTPADIQAVPSPCGPDNTRTVYYVWREPRSCVELGDTKLPAPVTGVHCDQICGPGKVIKGNKCVPCEANTFSVGGGELFDDWSNGVPRAFTSHCYSEINEQWHKDEQCDIWKVDNGVLHSGDNIDNHKIISTLKLQATFVREGWVRFTFKVDAEPWFDYFAFFVDEAPASEHFSKQQWYRELNITIQPGPHVLRWQYVKDGGNSEGLDRVDIESIEVVGTEFSALECKACPKGQHSSEGAASCSQCPRNTYSDPTLSHKCIDCEADEYAIEGARSCSKRLPCEVNDFTARYSDCQANDQHKGGHSRSLIYEWLEPHVCDETCDECAKLPPSKPVVACAPCNPGQVRKGANCVSCADGWAALPAAVKGAVSTKCEECPPGTAATKAQIYRYFYEWAPGFATGCNGDCASKGWRLHDSMTDSGLNHGNSADVWMSLTTALENDGSISFDYGLSCGVGGHSQFAVYIDDELVLGPRRGEGDYKAKFVMSTGFHTIKWVFNKNGKRETDRVTVSNIVVDGALNGGAAKCVPCQPGTVAPTSGNAVCRACAPGQTSGPEAKTCSSCPAGTFAPRVASPQCDECGPGTTSSKGASQCGHTCSASFDDGMTLYNLTKLSSHGHMLGPLKHAGRHFFVSICEPQAHNNGSLCVNKLGHPLDTFSCEHMMPKVDDIALPILGGGGLSPATGRVAPQMAYNLGSVIGFHPLVPATSSGVSSESVDGKGLSADSLGVSVVYKGGDICKDDSTKQWSTVVDLQCDLEAGVGTPAITSSNDCVLRVQWRSSHACPVCQEVDFHQIVSRCERGSRESSFHTDRVCFGGFVASLPVEESCSEVVLSTGIVILIVLGIGGLVALVTFMYLRHRRVYSRYMLLRHEMNDLGDIKLHDHGSDDEGGFELDDDEYYDGYTGGRGDAFEEEL